MVTDHLGKLGRRTSGPSHIFRSALLRRTPLLDVALRRSTRGCLPASVLLAAKPNTAASLSSHSPFQETFRTPQQRSIGFYRK
jgi:hypothetical protein